jgi:hypothetical protein
MAMSPDHGSGLICLRTHRVPAFRPRPLVEDLRTSSSSCCRSEGMSTNPFNPLVRRDSGCGVRPACALTRAGLARVRSIDARTPAPGVASRETTAAVALSIAAADGASDGERPWSGATPRGERQGPRGASRWRLGCVLGERMCGACHERVVDKQAAIRRSLTAWSLTDYPEIQAACAAGQQGRWGLLADVPSGVARCRGVREPWSETAPITQRSSRFPSTRSPRTASKGRTSARARRSVM